MKLKDIHYAYMVWGIFLITIIILIIYTILNYK